MRIALLPLSAALLLACAPAQTPPQPAASGQSFEDAMKAMCDVDRLAGLAGNSDPLTLGQRRTAWINAHVENPDGIELRTLVSVKGAADQAKMLREKATGCGVARCALADSLERDGDGGISP